MNIPDSGPWKRIEKIGDAVLILGDCLEVLPTLPKVDAVITDPPYGIAFCHGAGGDGIGGGKYVSKFNGVSIVGDNQPFDPAPWLQLASIVVMWGANHYADRLPPSPKWLVWDKRVGLTTNDFADCEMAWCSGKGVARVMRHYWNGMMRDSERGAPRVHPTQKPIEVMKWCIEQVANPHTILDPFMGSGTTGVACAQLGRKFIGIEIEEKYFNIAVERITNAYRQKPMFDSYDEVTRSYEQVKLL